jgi:hypothetical protein
MASNKLSPMIRKIFFLSISAVLLASAGNIKADTVTLTAGTASGDAGTAVIIPINLSGGSASTVSIVSFNLTYDPAALSFPSGDQYKIVKGDGGEMANVSIIAEDSIPPGTVSVALVEMNNPLSGNLPGDGQIVKIKFNILPGAPSGITGLSISNAVAINKDTQKMSITASNNGTVTVNSTSPFSNNIILGILFIIGALAIFMLVAVIIKKYFFNKKTL